MTAWESVWSQAGKTAQLGDEIEGGLLKDVDGNAQEEQLRQAEDFRAIWAYIYDAPEQVNWDLAPNLAIGNDPHVNRRRNVLKIWQYAQIIGGIGREIQHAPSVARWPIDD